MCLSGYMLGIFVAVACWLLIIWILTREFSISRGEGAMKHLNRNRVNPGYFSSRTCKWLRAKPGTPPARGPVALLCCGPGTRRLTSLPVVRCAGRGPAEG